MKQYPKWKLNKLGEYSGPLTNRVFEYLDSLSRVVDDYESPRKEIGYLPDNHNGTNREKECGVKLFKGLCEIMQNAPKGEAKKQISELHAKLRKEYPQFAGNLKC